MLTRSILALLLTCIASAAHAQARIVPNPEADARDGTIVVPNGNPTAPIWLSLPKAHDFAISPSDKARLAQQSGSAVLQCKVNGEGWLENCTLLKEWPDGFDYGQAALKMSRLFRMESLTTDGKPTTGRTINLNIEFPKPFPLR